MGIVFSPATKSFHIQARDTSLVLQVVRDKYLASRYWGRRLERWNDSSELTFLDRPFVPNPFPDDRTFSLDTLPQEYPAFGNTDFRSPAFQVRQEDGSTVTDLAYQSYRIVEGKPELDGLPSVYAESPAEAQTLEVTLVDAALGLEVILSWTLMVDLDVVTRSVRFRNQGPRPLTLLRALSASFDFEHSRFELLQLSGSWARERHLSQAPLHPGVQGFGSARGASSHQHNPFLALVTPGTDEDTGEVRAMNLVYSGNFLAQAEVDPWGGTRMSLGINPFEFTWNMDPGASFQTPEAVLVYSHDGLGGMSRKFHQTYRTRLCRGAWRDRERPVLINNWEATYFDFNEAKILALAEEARAVGIELLVLDDGWFGRRDDDKTSLGDWVVDRRKLPGGLASLAEGIRSRGLQFGLWFEPEMFSPDSDLYRAHPDWCLHTTGRTRSEGRSQLVLDLSRTDVQDHLVAAVSKVLREAPISYVKWDMNRHQTEAGSALLPADRQAETQHRYMLGLYSVMERITSAFPAVLFESCSGGGGRFDPGILFYMPQAWTSDNTDAVERLKIQWGTSLVYPPSSMGAHVSAVPNHQVNRNTPLRTRYDVARTGAFGYELDLTKLPAAEKDEIRHQVAEFKADRKLLQFGTFHRLLSPFEGNQTAWMSVSEDRRDAVVTFVRVLAVPNGPQAVLKLTGLAPGLTYRIDGTEGAWTGEELMGWGLRLPDLWGDYLSANLRLRAQ